MRTLYTKRLLVESEALTARRNARRTPSGAQERSLIGPPLGATSCFTLPVELTTLMPLALGPLATATTSCAVTPRRTRSATARRSATRSARR